MRTPIQIVLAASIIISLATSCNNSREIEEIQLRIEIDDPLTDDPNAPLNEDIKALINYIEVGDTLVYVPKVNILRTDIDDPNGREIRIQDDFITRIRKWAGAYKYPQIREHYNRELPKLKLDQTYLTKPQTIDTHLVLDLKHDSIFYICNSKMSTAPNKFENVVSLKSYLTESLTKGLLTKESKIVIKFMCPVQPLPLTVSQMETLYVTSLNKIPKLNADSDKISGGIPPYNITPPVDSKTSSNSADTIKRTYKVTDSIGSSVTFKQIIIITKYELSIECPSPTELNSIQSIPNPDPNVIKIKAQYKPVTIKHVRDNLKNKNGAEYVERVYRATDANGNRRECLQIFYIKPVKLEFNLTSKTLILSQYLIKESESLIIEISETSDFQNILYRIPTNSNTFPSNQYHHNQIKRFEKPNLYYRFAIKNKYSDNFTYSNTVGPLTGVCYTNGTCGLFSNDPNK